jgi:hypothetical protein
MGQQTRTIITSTGLQNRDSNLHNDVKSMPIGYVYISFTSCIFFKIKDRFQIAVDITVAIDP